MNKLHRKLEYSLIALRHMSLKSQGELTTAKEVAESFHAPFEAVARALQVLTQKGLLRSEYGVQGGYIINKDLSKVSLLELIEMVEGPTQIAKCVGSRPTDCDIQSKCNIISPVHNLNERLSEFYQSLSVQEILSSADHRPEVNL